MSPLERLLARFPSMLMAKRNLTRVKVRSALATLGIIIGVLAIASIGIFGVTLETTISSSFGDLGSALVVTPNANEGVEHLTDRDVRQIERAAPAATVLPLRSTSRRLTAGRQTRSVTVYGADQPGAVYDARAGDIPTPLRSGIVVGDSLATDLELEVGDSVTLGGDTERVRAIIEQQPQISALNINTAVFVPTADVDQEGYGLIYVQATSAQQANVTAQAIKGRLNGRTQRVSVIELSSFVDQLDQLIGYANTILLGLGGISLLVAGISILNVMLMSIIERREEIGVLRAVGFQRLQVLRVILAEAVMLGLIGGSLGAAVSLVLGVVINVVVLQDPLATFQWAYLQWLFIGFAFGVGTSLVTGLYPAWKAANEEPVEALRG